MRHESKSGLHEEPPAHNGKTPWPFGGGGGYVFGDPRSHERITFFRIPASNTRQREARKFRCRLREIVCWLRVAANGDGVRSFLLVAFAVSAVGCSADLPSSVARRSVGRPANVNTDGCTNFSLEQCARLQAAILALVNSSDLSCGSAGLRAQATFEANAVSYEFNANPAWLGHVDAIGGSQIFLHDAAFDNEWRIYYTLVHEQLHLDGAEHPYPILEGSRCADLIAP